MSNECLICLDLIHDQNTDIPVFKCMCKGSYHDKCINEWFIMKKSILCPICLQEFNDNHIIDIRNNSFTNKYCDSECYIGILKIIVFFVISFSIFLLVTHLI